MNNWPQRLRILFDSCDGHEDVDSVIDSNAKPIGVSTNLWAKEDPRRYTCHDLEDCVLYFQVAPL